MKNQSRERGNTKFSDLRKRGKKNHGEIGGRIMLGEAHI